MIERTRVVLVTWGWVLVGCAGNPIEAVGQSGEVDSDASGDSAAEGDTGSTPGPGKSDDGSQTGGSGSSTTGDGASDSVGDESGPGSSDGASGDSGPFVCGDGVVEGLEQCDDGNLDNTDDCTEACAPPSCADELRSGDESDVDCGGSCESKCARGSSCGQGGDCELESVCRGQTCRVPRSCAELLDAHGELESGMYEIDRDGSVTELRCDMQGDGGGWTRVSAETFDDGVDEGWSDDETYTCAGLGATMLGGFGNVSGGSLERTWDLAGLQHAEVRVEGELVILDSWDGESAIIEVDGEEAWSVQCRHNQANTCGQAGDECGGTWDDGVVDFEFVVSHDAQTVTLRFSSDLNEGPQNESWGIDELELWAR